MISSQLAWVSGERCRVVVGCRCATRVSPHGGRDRQNCPSWAGTSCDKVLSSVVEVLGVDLLVRRAPRGVWQCEMRLDELSRSCTSRVDAIRRVLERSARRDETILGVLTGTRCAPELRQLCVGLLGGTLAVYEYPGRVRKRVNESDFRVRACYKVVMYRR